MSVLEFTASIVESLSVPIVFLVVARWVVKVWADSFEDDDDEENDVTLLMISRDTISRLLVKHDIKDDGALRVVDEISRRLDNEL